jgi:hypothetical protein
MRRMRMLTEDNPRPAFISWWTDSQEHRLDHGQAKQVAALLGFSRPAPLP